MIAAPDHCFGVFVAIFHSLWCYCYCYLERRRQQIEIHKINRSTVVLYQWLIQLVCSLQSSIIDQKVLVPPLTKRVLAPAPLSTRNHSSSLTTKRNLLCDGIFQPNKNQADPEEANTHYMTHTPYTTKQRNQQPLILIMIFLPIDTARNSTTTINITNADPSSLKITLSTISFFLRLRWRWKVVH